MSYQGDRVGHRLGYLEADIVDSFLLAKCRLRRFAHHVVESTIQGQLN